MGNGELVLVKGGIGWLGVDEGGLRFGVGVRFAGWRRKGKETF